MKTATISDLLSWGPCYDETHIRRLAGDQQTFTAVDVLRRGDIPIDDRLWVALRPELISDRTLRLWACWCVRHTPLADERMVWDLLTDARSRAAIEVTERFANGEATEDERVAARVAALAVARDAAGVAARDAQTAELIRMLGEEV